MPVKLLLPLLLFCALALPFRAESHQLVHVFVALCDNENQGIVPVPERIGNGQDPRSNLYWGAGYGVKNFFDRKTADWEMVPQQSKYQGIILDRILFRHIQTDTWILADAYDGAEMQKCLEDYFEACNGNFECEISANGEVLSFGGESGLVGFVGHNGLMDTDIQPDFKPISKSPDAFALGCYTRSYFTPYMKQAGAHPVCWTTHLMSPEAYSVHAIIEGWRLGEGDQKIEERAAVAYNAYQKCGIKGARNLMASGYKAEK